jgi:hypothetical protein
MKIGSGKIIRGNFKIIHYVNLSDFDDYLQQVSRLLNSDHFDNETILYGNVKYLMRKIADKLQNITPRKVKRSINWIGSGIKWIAGNPDHDDFEVIKDHLNKVLKNNQQQVVINQQFSNHINDISRLFNQINVDQRSEKIISKIFWNLQHLDNELQNIILAIHLAKQNIINTQILNNEEIEMAMRRIDVNKFPYQTIEDALNYANIKIAADKGKLIYIIDLPITLPEIYDVLKIFYNRVHSPTIVPPYEEILQHTNKIYGIKSACQTISNTRLCKEEKLADISSTNCIPKLLQGKESDCGNSNLMLHETIVEEIDDGLIILNNFDGKILSDCYPRNRSLRGTFVIKFLNCTLDINGKIFQSTVVKGHYVIPEIYREFDANFTAKIPPTKVLEMLHLNNTQQIEILKDNTTIQFFSTSLLYGLVLTLLLAYIIYQRKQHQTKIPSDDQEMNSVIPETSTKHRVKGNQL